MLSAARPWLVWGLSALFVVYNYLQQVVPGLITPDLVREFHVSAGELGSIAALFFYAYALLQFPVGLIVDRFGPHRPLVAAVAVAALGSALFSMAAGAGGAGLARLVIGAGAAFSFIATLKLVSNWFPPERFATLAGLTNTAGMIGAAGGGAPLALVVAAIGWRGSLGLLGAVGAGLAVSILLLVRDHPPASPDKPPPRRVTDTAEGWRGGEVSAPGTDLSRPQPPAGASMGAPPPLARLTPLSPPEDSDKGNSRWLYPKRTAEVRSVRTPERSTRTGSIAHGLHMILADRQGWVNALYATAISIVFVAFGALWGTTYVEKAYGVSRLAASAAVSVLFLGAIPGSMFFGWVSDRARRRKAPMLAAAVGALAAMCALLYLPRLSLDAVRALLGTLGFFCSANIVSYAVSHDISPPGRAGLALGFLNTCFYAGNAVSQPLVGWLLDFRATGRGAAGIPGIAGLEAADFRFALSSVVAALVLALLAALLLRESHPLAAAPRSQPPSGD